MLFYKEKQLAFVLNPKSGSTAARAFLLGLGMKHVPTSEDDHIIARVHLTPDKAFAAYPNLGRYTTYGFFRNPVDRFISGISNIHEKLEDNFDKLFSPHYFPHTLFRPQVDWLNHPNVTVLDYANYKDEMKRIAELFGVSGIAPQKMNTTKSPMRRETTPAIEAFVREKYAADYEFAKRVLGKEY